MTWFWFWSEEMTVLAWNSWINIFSIFLQTSTPSGQNEEEKLRRKLSELAGNLSDKGLSSDDEAGKKSFSVGKGLAAVRGGPVVTLDSLKDKELSSSSDEMPTEAQKVGRRSGRVIWPDLFMGSNSGWSLRQMGTWRFVKQLQSFWP